MIRSILLFALVLVAIGLSAQAPEAEIARIEQRIQRVLRVKGETTPTFPLEERMRHYRVPGLSIAVFKDGQLHWAKSYGLADTQMVKPVTNATLFQAASISKPVAALAALKLVEAGKVDLNTDVNEYLTSWKLPGNKYTRQQPVTLRHLLSHTGGVTVHGFPGYTQDMVFPSTVDVLDGKGNTDPIRVDTLPGSKWRYSGGGFTIMQQLVEDVSGQPFAQFAQEQVLEPIGMKHSGFLHPLPAERHNGASAAYDSEGKMIEGKWHNYPELAAAGLWTTPSDLAAFAIELSKIVNGGEGVLASALVDSMLTEVKNGYGLGVGVYRRPDTLQFSHGGSNAGFKCHLVADALQNSGVVIMANADQGYSLLQEIEVAIGEEYGWELLKPREIELLAMTPAQLEKFTGTYQYTEQVDGIGDYFITIRLEEDRLVVHDPNDGEIRYPRALSETEFIDIDNEDGFRFDTEDGALVLYWNDNFKFTIVDKATGK